MVRVSICVVLLSACTVLPPAADGGGDPGDAPVAPACTEGQGRCRDGALERCAGAMWTVERTCDAMREICDEAVGCRVVDPCTRAELERSNVGCAYLAADLPQPRVSSWPIPFAWPWRAQYGVAISNPWPEPVNVEVHQNDALPGEGFADGLVASVTIAGNAVELIPSPAREVSGLASDMGPPSRSVLSNRAYRITSDLPVVAYQFNPVQNAGVYSDDASLLVPVHSLDESYVAIGWPGRGADGPLMIPADNRSFLTVVAASGPTRLRVVPRCPVMAGDGVPALAAGEAFEVQLDELGVLNLEGADVAVAGPTDFSGTIVEADRPIAVFSSVEAINISSPGGSACCADHLEEQLLPRSALGTEYVVVRSRVRRPARAGDPEEDYVKILALDDGTTVTTTLPGDDASFTLNRGQSRVLFTAASFTVSASRPVVVAQFLLSGGAIVPPTRDPLTGEETDPGEQIGDPSFMTVPPLAQFRREYRFLVPAGYENDTAMIAAPSGTAPMLDGAPLSCRRAPIGLLAGTEWEALHCDLPDGGHHLGAGAPIGLVIMGHGPGVVSYGYTGGLDFEPINQDCVEDADCPGGEFCSGGYCTEEIDLF
jgi:hypothetical protein